MMSGISKWNLNLKYTHKVVTDQLLADRQINPLPNHSKCGICQMKTTITRELLELRSQHRMMQPYSLRYASPNSLNTIFSMILRYPLRFGSSRLIIFALGLYNQAKRFLLCGLIKRNLSKSYQLSLNKTSIITR